MILKIIIILFFISVLPIFAQDIFLIEDFDAIKNFTYHTNEEGTQNDQKNIDNKKPNIIFIMADDLGWNDVSFHGMNSILTPNIDALAYNGIILQNYYVCPICTPSRSALMTGMYPIHTGMQHTVLFGAEKRGLPLKYKILPQYLADLGYTNKIVGKWHLGSYKKEYTPTFRGFESHVGFWTGHHDYNDHTAMETGMWGLDARNNLDVAYEAHGRYSTDWFTDESVKIIKNHKKSADPRPLFLYVAHAAVHSGNPYNPLAAPDEVVANFTNIDDFNRRKFAGILTKLDQSVGKIVQALGESKMLDNSIIIFSSDNGGPAEGFNLNAASNWPLRGVKNTLWEGGIKGAALMWSKKIMKSKRVARQFMHITDWLPTLYSAAGGNVSDLGAIDGMDLWQALSEDQNSKRLEILHNIDDEYGNAALTVGEWKLVKGTSYSGQWDGWYGPDGKEGNFDPEVIRNSPAGQALKKVGHDTLPEEIINMRKASQVSCGNGERIECKPLKAPCLFNIQIDPCEKINLADQYPAVVKSLLNRLQGHNRTVVPPGNLPVSKEGDPNNWNHVWTNFGDFEIKN